MAVIKASGNINSISGSIGSNIFSSNKGKLYIRSKPKTVSNPQSNEQTYLRARTAECAKCWNNILTQDERNAWETYAKNIITPTSGPGDIIKPAKGPFSGFTAFIKNNVTLFFYEILTIGQFLKIAPLGITPPDAPVNVNVIWNNPALEATWTAGTVTGDVVAVYVRAPNVSIHKQLIGFEPALSEFSSEIDIKGANGTYIPLAKLRTMIDAQLIAIDQYGQLSPASELIRGVNVTGI